jgi:hypothetical protein
MLACSVAGGLAHQIIYPAAAYAIFPPQSVIPDTQPVLDTTGKVEVPCGLVTSERTAVLVFIGQSLSVNQVPTPYVTQQDRNHQLNIYDGKCYKTQDPLLGINVSGGAVTDARGTWMSRLGDSLIADGHYDRVVLVPMAVGNTSVGQWASDTAAPYLKNNFDIVAQLAAVNNVSVFAGEDVDSIGASGRYDNTHLNETGAAQRAALAEAALVAALGL